MENEKDNEGQSKRIFLVTYGEAKTRAALFPADLQGIKGILGRMLSDLVKVNESGIVEFRDGLVDFLGRVVAYKYNLLRVSCPESLLELFTYGEDIHPLFAEGVITAAGIVERISQEEVWSPDIKLQADHIKMWVMGLL